MIMDKATEYEHERDFAPPPEPPPSYDGARAPFQPSYPAPQEPIPYANQQPSTRYPAPQGSSYPPPQGPPYNYPASSTSLDSSSKSTPPPPARTFAPFDTLTVPTLRYRLADGFSPDLPPSHEQPHPFASHDVTQEDWLAFLGDIRRVTQNTSEERLRETFGAEPSSFVSGLGRGSSSRGRGGLVSGLIGAIAEGVSKSVSGGSSKAAQEPISLLIADWNRNFWNHRNIEAALKLNDVPANPYGSTSACGLQPSQGRGPGLGLRTSRSPRRGERRAQKRAERSAFGTELIADVHDMFGAKESSAAYRAAADEERYAGKPGWCLVLRYKGPAPGPSYAGGGSGWATRA